MHRERVAKDFDDPAVQAAPGPAIEEMWSEEARALYGEPRDTAVDVGLWLQEQGVAAVLDVGCGTGLLRRGFQGDWVGVDISVEQLRRSGGRRVLADALSLPFADQSFPAVTALYVLYFFSEPGAVVEEAKRVLRPGGWFVACAPSRFDAPELAHVIPRGEDGAFSAEDVPALLFEHLRDVRITPWDFPAFHLRSRGMVRDYLYSWYYPQLTIEEAEQRSRRVEVPLKLTKRGIWGAGRKPG